MVSIKERFIIFPDVLMDAEQMIILSAWEFWNEHETELQDWCQENNADFVGMTVTFPDKKTLTSFCLKWS